MMPSTDDPPASERRLDLADPAAGQGPPVPGAVAQCDIAAFGNGIHAALKSSVVGYEFALRHNGTKVYELSWSWSRTPVDGSRTWNENQRMHVASVSQLLTAVAMVKALDEAGVSYDATISGCLPAYWTTGPKVDQITFRHLMTHRSGFSTGTGTADFAFMKAQVAAGVATAPGSAEHRENMNFGLCRILLPIVAGIVDKDALMPDAAWDAATLDHYKSHMQANVFTPAGLGTIGWAPTAGGVLAYRQPDAGLHGWSSGDLRSMAGSDGWRLTVKELLDVMNHVRRKDTIVPAPTAQELLDNRFGIDDAVDTPAGRTYAKSGIWGAGSGEVEQCAAFFLPEGLEAALFVNSPIGTQGHPLRTLVQEAYEGSLSA